MRQNDNGLSRLVVGRNRKHLRHVTKKQAIDDLSSQTINLRMTVLLLASI